MLCTDNTYYTGVTNDLETQFLYHQNGQNPNSYTYTRRPVEIVYYTEFNNVNQAIAFEKQVKGWSRAKKEAIINDEWETLPNLSRRKFPNQ